MPDGSGLSLVIATAETRFRHQLKYQPYPAGKLENVTNDLTRMTTVSRSSACGVLRRSSADIGRTHVRNRSCCGVAPMMTGSPAHRLLGQKQLTIRQGTHIRSAKDCGCFTGNLLATISRARRKIPAVGSAERHISAALRRTLARSLRRALRTFNGTDL